MVVSGALSSRQGFEWLFPSRIACNALPWSGLLISPAPSPGCDRDETTLARGRRVA
jgi:hypothetical protein